MASICNDERVAFGVMSGHGRKTLRLSGLAPLLPGDQLADKAAPEGDHADDEDCADDDGNPRAHAVGQEVPVFGPARAACRTPCLGRSEAESLSSVPEQRFKRHPI